MNSPGLSGSGITTPSKAAEAIVAALIPTILVMVGSILSSLPT